MTIRIPEYRLVIPGRPTRITAILSAALVTGAAYAQELPSLRAGLWEVSRTIDAASAEGAPQTVSTTECASPDEGMAAREAMLKTIGCQLSPLARSGSTVTFSAVCSQGTGSSTKTILTVDSDSAYSIRIDTIVGGTQSRELLNARRVGDCPP